MGKNSIRDNLDKNSLRSELRLILGADYKKEIVCLILEGDSDRKLMRKFVSSNVTTLESCDGKRTLQEIVAVEYRDENRVIGIRDRDYSSCIKCEKLFYYDFCCLEMMILKNEEIFESIYHEHYIGTKNMKELREAIFKKLKGLSILRKINEEKKLGINFEIISMHRMNTDIELLEIESFCNILKMSNDHELIDKAYLEAKGCINNIEDKDKFLDITNGHDFIDLFVSECKIVNSNSNLSKKTVESAIRCSYNFGFFSLTDLYRSLINYEKNNNINIVKSTMTIS